LDVAASAIKGVKMRAAGDRVEILEADIQPLEGDPTPSESPGRDRRIWRGLQEFHARHDFRRTRVAVGLPGSLFFTRPFNFPLLASRSQEELARFELDQHIPFGLDAVLWDYEIFEPSDPTSREREGLLFAMKKDVLNNYLLSLSAAHIEPDHIQAAPLALYHFIRRELDPQAPVLVMDVGSVGAGLIAIHGERYWLRSVNVGGEALTAALRAAFHPRELSREDEESIKMNLGRLTRRAEVVEKIERSLRSFVGQLRNAVEHVRREHKLDFERIILVGGGAQMYRLPRLLGEELNTRVVTPAGLGRTIDVAESADPPYVNQNLPSLATAVGLGLQVLTQPASRVNMVGATLLRRRSQTMVRRTAVAALVMLALLVGGFGGLSGWRKRMLRSNLAEIQNLVTPARTRRKRFKGVTKVGKAEHRLEAFRRMAEGRVMWLRLLNKIARMLPENEKRSTKPDKKTWLVDLNVKELHGAEKKKSEKGLRVYEGTLRGGVLLADDRNRPDYAESILIPPLEKEESGIFKEVELFGSKQFSSLAPPTRQGPDKYLVLTVRFRVIPSEAAPP